MRSVGCAGLQGGLWSMIIDGGCDFIDFVYTVTLFYVQYIYRKMPQFAYNVFFGVSFTDIIVADFLCGQVSVSSYDVC